jgi:hypothetical protein
MTFIDNRVSPRAKIFMAFAIAVVAGIAFIGYQLHDVRAPFAFGHKLWAEAYVYEFARAHLDLGLAVTRGLNVEGVTGSGAPIFYLSAAPLTGLLQAGAVWLFGGEPWTVRVLPLLLNSTNAALLALLLYRWAGVMAALLSVPLFLGAPFIIEYGSSNEGVQVYAITLGLGAYILYQRFLAGAGWLALIAAFGMLGVGVGFNWLAGFMAFAMLAHLWLQPISVRMKLRATIIAAGIVGVAILLVLVHQGIATGDFTYPLRRAVERNHATGDTPILWTPLLQLQASRYWNYFGPVVAGLDVYWLVRRVLPRPLWRPVDTWLAFMWIPGLVYALLLRDAAYHHDFLMLGFTPAAVGMASVAIVSLMEDAVAVVGNRASGLPVMIAAGVLAIHAVGAVRSAQNFQRQAALDLAQGVARVAYRLRDLPAGTILAADRTARMASLRDPRDGAEYVSLFPTLDYLVRRPVYAVDDVETLQALRCHAARSGRSLVLLQTGASRERSRFAVPLDAISQTESFDQVKIIHLADYPAARCTGTGFNHQSDRIGN